MSPARSERGLDARDLACDTLDRVATGGAFATVLLDHHQGRLADRRDKALARELTLGVLRRRALVDHTLATVSSRPLDRIHPPVLTVLRVAAYEILFLERIPEFASVSSALERLKRRRLHRAAGFANAVLRAVARRGAALLPPEPSPGDVAALAVYGSHPEWWVERAVGRFGEERTRRLMDANNRPAPTVIAPNPLRVAVADLPSTLAAQGVRTEPCAYVPGALRVREGIVQASAAFRDGLCRIQDEASQLVPRMFGKPGPRVADLCAAPGGKTLALAAELPADGRLVAVDRKPARLRAMREQLERAGVDNVTLVAADLAAVPAIRGTFDDVLVDAPCTGTGTLRRNPEIRWRLRPDDPARLGRLQARILQSAAALVARGGRLLYSVCSLEPAEGHDLLSDFLREHPEFEPVDPRSNLPEAARELVDERYRLCTAPDRGGLDGFQAALLRRRP